MPRLFKLASASLLLTLTPWASAQAPAASDAAAGPIVTVREGKLQGKTQNGISTFLNVPFAAPPVGALRWKMPQPAARWSGVRPATKYGAACAQAGAATYGLTNTSEDCLQINIFTPNVARGTRLPVMIYFHGGGFTGGSGTIQSFDGTALGKQGVILVTANYRLGIFGFFAHPELTRESGHKASGNYGLADQSAAMKWVQGNIAAFGGDPARVTIFGQSAGSISVLDQMTSPLARGLFHRVIAESGTPMLRNGTTTLAEAAREGAAFATAQKATVAQLRTMPADALMKAWTAARGSSWPIIDGYVLPESPRAVFAAHREARVPLITGSNAREALGGVNDAALRARLQTAYGAAAPRALKVYAPLPTPDPVLGTAANMYATDATFRCPAVILQSWHAEQGAPVYGYHFEDPLPGREAMGSQHSDEVSFVFGTLEAMSSYLGKHPTPAAAKLSEQMVIYWANFAKNGNPNGPGVPKWPRFTAKDRAFQRLTSQGVRSDTNLRGEACDLYRDAAVDFVSAR
jgi:para-nitrobenzyl esterase